MRISVKFAVTILSVVALVVLMGTAAGCGGGGGSDWERVLSTEVSGEQPVKLNLGAHELGDRVRLAWTLSGPENPPVTLALRLINVDNGGGYGTIVSSETSTTAIARQDDQAMTLAPGPGTYRVYFSQRFLPARGPGYDITLTLWTMWTPTPDPSPSP